MNRKLYQVAVVALMLTQMGVVMGLASPNLSDTDLGVVSDQDHLPVIITTAFSYLFVLGRLFVAPRRFVAAISNIGLLIPLMAYTVLSAMWSSAPDLTMRRSFFFLLSTLIAFILATDFDLLELMQLFAVASLIHMSICIMLLAVAPHMVYSPSDAHSLKGLTTHKNFFGLEIGMATLALFLVPLPRLQKLRIPLGLIAFTLLYLSHSAGSLVATVLALVTVPLQLILSLPGKQRVPVVLTMGVVLIGSGYWILDHVSLLPALLGKDSTLTGRTELWSLIVIAIKVHPLLGYGFDSFWQGLQGDSLTIIRSVGWLVPTAHNGYLDLLLSTGWIGVFLFVPFCVQTINRCLRFAAERAVSMPLSIRFFPFALLVFLLVYNLNESALLTRSGMPFMLWVAVSTSIGLRLNPAKDQLRIQNRYGLLEPAHFESVC
jgi:exopolysaccharide production protein ExoQ